MQAGMSIIRMNFSHGSYEVCLGVILIALYSIGGDDETACKDVDDIVAIAVTTIAMIMSVVIHH